MAYRTRRGRAGAALLTAGLMVVVVPPTGAGAAPVPRIDLRVLVVDDGGAPVGAIAAELKSTGVPYTVLDLDEPGRPVIDAAFLGDTLNGTPRAKYQGVVLPNADPFGAGSAEGAALAAYERTFGIRQVDAYTWAHPGVGLDHTGDGGYAGTLDGVAAAITPAGRAGPFGYLEGAVEFEDRFPRATTRAILRSARSARRSPCRATRSTCTTTWAPPPR